MVTSRLLMASDILWSLTGRRYSGSCTDTVRPVFGGGCWSLVGWDGEGWGELRSLSWPRPEMTSRVGAYREIKLPGYPVTGVSSVKVDGVTLDAARYDLVDDRYLMFLPESPDAALQTWPRWQDLSVATTEPNSFEIAYGYGMAPPEGGKVAAAALACELLLAADPERRGKCRLPRRVQSVSRQGVSMAVLDNPTDLFDKGLTGIPEVDLWITSEVRGRARRPSAVMMPDQPRRFYRGR